MAVIVIGEAREQKRMITRKNVQAQKKAQKGKASNLGTKG